MVDLHSLFKRETPHQRLLAIGVGVIMFMALIQIFGCMIGNMGSMGWRHENFGSAYYGHGYMSKVGGVFKQSDLGPFMVTRIQTLSYMQTVFL